VNRIFNAGKRSNLFFRRNKSGHEIDVIVDHGLSFDGIEIKSSKTFNKIFMKNLDYPAERDSMMKGAAGGPCSGGKIRSLRRFFR